MLNKLAGPFRTAEERSRLPAPRRFRGSLATNRKVKPLLTEVICSASVNIQSLPAFKVLPGRSNFPFTQTSKLARATHYYVGLLLRAA